MQCIEVSLGLLLVAVVDQKRCYRMMNVSFVLRIAVVALMMWLMAWRLFSAALLLYCEVMDISDIGEVHDDLKGIRTKTFA